MATVAFVTSVNAADAFDITMPLIADRHAERYYAAIIDAMLIITLLR